MGDNIQERGPWIIAGAILIAASVIAGIMLMNRSQDQACKNWQAEFQKMAGTYARGETDYGTFTRPASDGKASARLLLGPSQPEGCPEP